jgi:hypothetical protein
MKFLQKQNKSRRRYTKRLAKKGAAVSDAAYRQACERTPPNHPPDSERARTDLDLQRRYFRESQPARTRQAALQPVQRAIKLPNRDAGDPVICGGELKSLVTALQKAPVKQA